MKTDVKDTSIGLHETIEHIVSNLDLNSACIKIAETQKWSQEKIKDVEKKYRDILSNFTQAFVGYGVVACSEEDVALLWLVHCAEGEKYASDMLNGPDPKICTLTLYN
ncbi:MAG: hypothetical protein AAB484_00330 [Patescibacteria group bacterium]